MNPLCKQQNAREKCKLQQIKIHNIFDKIINYTFFLPSWELFLVELSLYYRNLQVRKKSLLNYSKIQFISLYLQSTW